MFAFFRNRCFSLEYRTYCDTNAILSSVSMCLPILACRQRRQVASLLFLWLLPVARGACDACGETCLLQVPARANEAHARKHSTEKSALSAQANENEEVPEVYSTRGSAQIIALDTGILHGPANTILAAKRAVEAGARALNVDAVLSGRLYLRIYTCAFTSRSLRLHMFGDRVLVTCGETILLAQLPFVAMCHKIMNLSWLCFKFQIQNGAFCPRKQSEWLFAGICG